MAAPPKSLDRIVLRFCRLVNRSEKPQFIPINATEGAKINDCFPNVSSVVDEKGGKAVNGWAIWVWPSVFIEAEFHSVWERPDGELICVTPRDPDFKWLLFVPDPKRKYEGFQIDNIRKPLKKSGLINKFISNAEAIYKEMNKGELKFFVGEIKNPSKYLVRLFEEKQEIENKMFPLFGHKLISAIEERLKSPKPDS